jgi:uncharacterized membrane protein
MDTLISILHVTTAVFIVGPMAILPMTAMRAVRAGNGGQVAVLAKSTMVFSWLSLLTFLFGFGAMAMAPEEFGLTFTTPWILWSIILYVIAFLLSVFLVVPSMRKAAEALSGDAGSGSGAAQAGYPAIAAGSGVVSLLLVAVVVLMVWKP